MFKLLILATILLLWDLTPAFSQSVTDSSCANGWTAYRDEKCIKVFKIVTAYENATKICRQASYDSISLLSIRSDEEQQFVSNLLFDTHQLLNDVWLGAKLVPGTHNFQWISNNADLRYTNWVPGSPSYTDEKSCVQLIGEGPSKGRWVDEPCANKKNLVVCETIQAWSQSKLQQILLDARKESRDSIEEAKKEIADLKQNPVPVGFIYVQLPSQPEPQALWSAVTWADVTSEYAGLFFRAEGGDAASFGAIQEENTPRVTEVMLTYDTKLNDGYVVTKLNVGGWSSIPGVFSSYQYNAPVTGVHYHQFLTSGGEVRPRNKAMRIWKRIN